jgi:phosphopantetheinyl transferase
MPVVKLDKIGSNAYWCLWEITETVDDLRRKVTLSEHGKAEIESIHHPVKRKEGLAARMCVQEIMLLIDKSYKGLYKDEYDKPHLIGLDYNVSLAHSFPFATAIVHRKLPVGIDIEKPVDKLLRISNRFLSTEEQADAGTDLKKLCIYWTAKEAIYKLNGKNGLSFRRDIKIYPFDLVRRDIVRSEFLANGQTVKVALNYRELKGHIISYCF